MIDKLIDFNGYLYTNSCIKSKILKKFSLEKKLIKFKFISKDELIKNTLGYYDDNLIVDISKDKKDLISTNIIKLNSSLLVDEKIIEKKQEYSNNVKIKELLKYRDNLHKESFDLFKNNEIKFLDYYFDDDHINLSIKKLKSLNKNIDFIYNKKANEKNLTINSFKTQKNETSYVLNEIAKLVAIGVNLSDIYVYYGDSGYANLFNQYSELYNIPFNFNNSFDLFEYNDVKKLYNDLVKNNDLEIDKYIVPEHLKSDVCKYAIDIINDLVGYKYKIGDVIEYILYKFKNTKVKTNRLLEEINTNKVNVIDDYNNLIFDNEYLFIVGVNQNKIPTIKKDNDYLNDNDKVVIGIDTTFDKNKNEKKSFINMISRTKNVFLSYSLSSVDSKLIPSSIITDLKNNFKVQIVDFKFDYSTSYSKDALELEYYKEYEDYLKYNIVGENIKDLKKHFEYKKYQYSNKIKLNDLKLKEKIMKNPRISYSKINDYVGCPYQYYLKRILKINPIIKDEYNEKTLFIGLLIHDVLKNALELYINDPKGCTIDFDELIINYYKSKDIEITNESKLFNNIYKIYIEKIYEFILETMDNSSFKVISLEKDYEEKLKDDFVLEGTIDKVLETTIDGEKYNVVIDYKTGDKGFDLKKTFYGLDLQVLIYYKLLGGKNKVKFGGGYLSHIIPNKKFDKEKNKSYDEMLREFFKYDGYTNSDMNIMRSVDNNVKNGTYLKGVKFVNGGGLHSDTFSRIISNDQYENLMNLVDKKIDEIIDKLANCEFNIEPLFVSKCNCEYCKYKDICFKKQYDVEKKRIPDDLNFLNDFKEAK